MIANVCYKCERTVANRLLFFFVWHKRNKETFTKMKTNTSQRLKKLMKKILVVTMDIRNRYPALYEHLNETPLFFKSDTKEAHLADFTHYLESLTMQLETFELKKNTQIPLQY